MIDSSETPDAITDFYDRHPYPPPVTDLSRYRERWLDEDRRRAEYHLFWPQELYREDISVLVAGCGTSQAAKHAIRRPGAKVIGIDVSATGIAHNAELKDKHNLDNLELRVMPIEAVDEVGMTFDLIISTGVLHHLEDPQAGLVALTSVLDAGGALHLMVYASYGRTGIYMLQEYSRRLGVEANDDEIRDLIEVLGAVPRGHPIEHLLRARDFGKADAVADALLNPRDRSYTVPEILELLAAAGLDISRWYRQAPYLPQCGAVASTPHATKLDALSIREQFAAMELLRGTIARHSLVAHLQPAEASEISFDDGAWPGFIPILRPSTLAVRERLPAGAAAVLLNREHTFPDLVLPIDGVALQMYQSIDGRRPISEIAALAGSDVDTARALFQKLWWYDQVVFDNSGTSRSQERVVSPPVSR